MMGQGAKRDATSTESTPICRCRVVYLGSSVPHVTKDGLQGIQQPLKELYPESGISGARGIDSWLSVWSNGLLLENVDEKNKKVTRFFPIESLHYCAAVRFVVVPGGAEKVSRFLPLDSPFARSPNTSHRPLFACILRRTTGIKVLECHAFICKKENPANALVRCCFHAYADNMYARQIEGSASPYGTLYAGGQTQSIEEHLDLTDDGQATVVNGHARDASADDLSIYNGDENHKIWAGSNGVDDAYHDTLRSVRSMASSRPRQLAAPVPAPPPPHVEKSPPSAGKKKKKKAVRPATANGGLRPVMMRPVPLVYGTYADRRPPPRMLLLPPPPPPPPPPPMMMVPMRRPASRIMEEPIYMPSARAMSPIASYQPGHFPHEDYYFHYATVDRPQKQRRRGKKESDAGFSSGIYKKRGHLNERAFSYSIRQEDRSRSYGSLANIPFAANGDALLHHPHHGAQGGRHDPSIKDREMLQMVQDLDLSVEVLILTLASLLGIGGGLQKFIADSRKSRQKLMGLLELVASNIVSRIVWLLSDFVLLGIFNFIKKKIQQVKNGVPEVSGVAGRSCCGCWGGLRSRRWGVRVLGRLRRGGEGHRRLRAPRDIRRSDAVPGLRQAGGLEGGEANVADGLRRTLVLDGSSGDAVEVVQGGCAPRTGDLDGGSSAGDEPRPVAPTANLAVVHVPASKTPFVVRAPPSTQQSVVVAQEVPHVIKAPSLTPEVTVNIKHGVAHVKADVDPWMAMVLVFMGLGGAGATSLAVFLVWMVKFIRNKSSYMRELVRMLTPEDQQDPEA
ncbi:unnamed protein product [Notodromas monacha]|uniref:PID domain-containing protein n=1 Tax=Notodromas monacha TaxID=399045 RepID=A0A7R9BRZ3_9CRUS|nr:unnamed protein product [Notodromas monacha]CAG0919235.1 unnamed protein product [Notodromas monacha]